MRQATPADLNGAFVCERDLDGNGRDIFSVHLLDHNAGDSD
jgi:hypothetical protein